MQNKLSKHKISKLIKIKNPFLMIDKVHKLKALKSGLGIKQINKNSWFFKCHFINSPLMPGTLIQESMLQTIVSIIYSHKKFKNKICLITSSETSYFSKIAKPTTIYIQGNILRLTLTKIEAFAKVIDQNKTKIASGNFKYFITNK